MAKPHDPQDTATFLAELCPWCRSDEIDYHEIELVATEVIASGVCDHCGANWTAAFTVARVRPGEPWMQWRSVNGGSGVRTDPD